MKMQTESFPQCSSYVMWEKNQIIDLTGKEVAVIGGGNVSMDATRTAKTSGCKEGKYCL